MKHINTYSVVMGGRSKGWFCSTAKTLFFFLLIELVAEEGTKVAIVSVSNEPIH